MADPLAPSTPGAAFGKLGPLAQAALKTVAENRAAPESPMANIEQHSQWVLISRLPLKLSVGVPLPGFRVRDLLALRVGQTIASKWKVSEDVPIHIGGVQFAWNEFEVVEQRLAVRMTRLA